jgi:hypothetical protein
MTFLKGFLRIASELGLGTQARQIAHFIPKKLSNQKLSIDLFSKTTSYEFGTPYGHKGRPFAFGSQQMPRLDHFTLAFVAAFNLEQYIAAGADNGFPCYCGRGLKYYQCHGDDLSRALDRIRQLLKKLL